MTLLSKTRTLGRFLQEKTARLTRFVRAGDIGASAGKAIAVGLIAFFLLCLLANHLMGLAARNALAAERDGAYEPNERPWIPVSSFHTDDDDSGRFQSDDIILVDYIVKTDHNSLPADGIFHLSDMRYDAYYLPLQREGSTTLLLADMTYPRFLALQISVVAAGALALISFTLLLRARYQKNQRAAQTGAMEAFFTNATHELKTPLAAVQGYTEAVTEGMVELAEARPVITQATTSMAKTIDDIMRLGKIDAGMVRPHMLRTWDVREMVYDSARLIEAPCLAKGINLNLRLPRPLYYYCDPDMMHSVFCNLMANAARHGRSSITVSVEQETPALLVLRFENDGEPISDADLPHLFERFYHGDAGESGIGLAYVKELLELQGFAIEAQTSTSGTAFIVRIEN